MWPTTCEPLQVNWSGDNLENLFENAHSHDEYLWQVSLKSLHYVKRYHANQNRINRQTT